MWCEVDLKRDIRIKVGACRRNLANHITIDAAIEELG
jgi:hypothetical protein